MDYAKELYSMALENGANPDDRMYVLTKSQIKKWLIGCGYAERSATNHMAPSTPGGFIYCLSELNLIQEAGIKQWAIVSMESLKSYEHKKKTRPPRKYSGEPKLGNGWLKEPTFTKDVNGITWECYFHRYKEDCYNMKIIALPELSHKANFNINVVYNKVKSNKDALILKQNHPIVYKSVEWMFGEES